jgi:LmbE family N-acetylglucosaminyl deacetylase
MKKIIAIGAHPDDIEIGAGGTLARHAAEGYEVLIVVLIRGGATYSNVSKSIRFEEAKNGAKLIGAKIEVLDYPDTGCEKHIESIINDLEKIVQDFKPDRAYIHYNHEIHQDHVTANKASLVALRNCPQVLMFEGPSTFPDFSVDYWYDISLYTEVKRSAILAHASEGAKEILKLDAIESLNRYRGYQCRKHAAEGFKIFRFFE